ncbi:nucleotidyltransferase domain-containing protein [Geobacter sp.]|uniref:nucleotidyltransferase domain-containing protein n=1 Tax=Geobacter sp. TaxID=46610 RepID=UPI00260BFD32|nr:nucleotidyltransferase domain-containing protein [Geobacter sp.]
MAQRFPDKIDQLLAETRSELQRIYGPRLKEIILFGSYARGDFTDDSDVDIIIVLDTLQDIVTERERYLTAISDISLKYDTVVSVIPYEATAFHTRRSPLLLNIRHEGMAL